MDKAVWHDVSNEAWREYLYPGDQVVRVLKPHKLNVTKKDGGDRHRIIACDPMYLAGTREVGMYITPGWLAIRWQDHEGKHGVTF